jgi:hypothetical protein
MRVCNVHDVPIATNPAAADLFLTSSLLAPFAPGESEPPTGVEKAAPDLVAEPTPAV